VKSHFSKAHYTMALEKGMLSWNAIICKCSIV
jgi:hypothetical protein